MKIVADNRGRIALSKLNVGYSKKDEINYGVPGFEWDVSVEKGQLVIKPWEDVSKPEWVRVGALNPKDIGQVIGINASCLPGQENEIQPISSGVENSLVGTLEWYRGEGASGFVRNLKLTGQEPLRLSAPGVFYVRNV